MKKCPMFAVVFGCVAATAAWAEAWQETAAGTLQLLSATTLQTGCTAGNPSSYLSVPFSGTFQYNRAQYHPVQEQAAHFSFHADGAAPLQIIPLTGAVASFTQVPSSVAPLQRAAFWGIQPAGEHRGVPAFRLYWQDEAATVVRSARLTLAPLQWRPEWTVSYQPAVAPWLSDQLTPKRLADDPGREWLLLPGDAQVPVRLLDADNGLPRQLSLPATSGVFSLLPLAADPDLDGVSERLYLLSQQGALWQFDWQAGSGWQASLVADLQSSGWDFSGSLQRFAARWQSTAGWQEGEVFVILARSDEDYRLLVLRRGTNIQQALTFADVAAVPDLAKAGWYTELAEAPLSHAKVLAGVLYLPLKTDTGCAEDASYDQILALQLYSGAAAYDEPILRLAQPLQAPLRLVQSAQQLQLWSGTVPVFPRLMTLSPACLMCTEQLTPQHLQGQQTIAVFRREQVY